MVEIEVEYKIELKKVRLSDSKEIEFPVKICKPKPLKEQKVFSICHANYVGSKQK